MRRKPVYVQEISQEDIECQKAKYTDHSEDWEQKNEC